MNPFKKLGCYFTRVLIGLDQFANTILGGFPDETISARAGRVQEEKALAKALAKALDVIDKDHVVEAICAERTGTQQHPYYKDVYEPACEIHAPERPPQVETNQ